MKITEQNNIQCSICLDPPTDPESLVCAHVFCRSCIQSWADTKNRGNIPGVECPTCRIPNRESEPAPENSSEPTRVIGRSAQPAEAANAFLRELEIENPIPEIGSDTPDTPDTTETVDRHRDNRRAGAMRNNIRASLRRVPYERPASAQEQRNHGESDPLKKIVRAGLGALGGAAVGYGVSQIVSAMNGNNQESDREGNQLPTLAGALTGAAIGAMSSEGNNDDEDNNCVIQ